MILTVADLIDYLTQFAGDTAVVFSEQEATELPPETEYIQLDELLRNAADGKTS